MDGVRANLDDLAEARVRLDAITRARTAEEVPLATAVGLLARQRLTGEAPPHAARAGLDAGRAVDRGEGRGRARCAGADDRRPGGLRDAVAPAARGSRPRRADDRADQQPEEGGDEDQGEDEGPDESRRRRDRGRRRRRRDGNALRGSGARRRRGRERPRARPTPTKARRPAAQEGADQARASAVAAQLAGRAGHRLSAIHHPLRRDGRRPASCATRRN